MSRSWPSCRPTRRRWAGRSSGGAWRANWAPDWQSRFRDFEHEPRRAPPRWARCIARPRSTARALACKLQYPDMASAVEADLRQLKLAMGLYERYDRAVIDRRDPRRDLRPAARGARLRARGRAYAALRRDPAQDEPGCRRAGADRRAVDPAPADDDVARRRADPRHRRQRRSTVRNEIALRMFRIWYVPFYYYGVIHGDPHLGNYTVAAATAPSTCSISAASASSRRVSSRASSTSTTRLQRDDRDLAVHAYRELGFRQPVARDDRRPQPLGRASSTARCSTTGRG